MKKNITFLSAALLISVSICSCTAETENGGGENNLSAPEIITKSTFDITESAISGTAQETSLNEEEPEAVTSEEKDYWDYWAALEDNEYDKERMKHVNSEELKALDFSDCSVAALSAYHEKILEYLSEENRAGFIECIVHAEISSEEYEVPGINGGWTDYQITLNTGEQIYIGVIDDKLIINDECAYLCDRESLDIIEEYHRDAYLRFDSIAYNGDETISDTAVSEPAAIKNEPFQIRAEKEAEYYRTLEDNEIRREKMKSIGSKDLKSLDFDACSIAVLDNYGAKVYEYLSDNNAKYLIECVTKAEISAEEYDVPEKNGYSPYMFRVTLSTDEQIYIASISSDDTDLLVINGEHGYLCDEESVDKINELYGDVYRRFLDNAWNN